MLTKESVIKTVSTLPDNFSLDELIERLIFIDKVQKGLEESLTDKVSTTGVAKQRLSKWLK
jgi:hypothetical protein